MSDKYQNKYRIESARLQNWDYGWNAAYFVTICTKNKECFFGDVVNGEMQLSKIGELANKFWQEIPAHFSFVKLGEFIVMPNHTHGIIIIDKPNNKLVVETPKYVETPKLGVSKCVVTPKLGISTSATPGEKNDKWKPDILGVIINQYKRICTIQSRKIYANFAWQLRFYDHIIRNDKSFQNISKYIQNNPLNWHDDKFYNPL